jgi:proteic killer suppression protein
MIQSFRCKKTARFFHEGEPAAAWRSVSAVVARKLDILDAAVNLSDLRAPPGNRLEPLIGDRAGQHSIRINERWRICFIWTETGPADVEIVDYH